MDLSRNYIAQLLTKYKHQYPAELQKEAFLGQKRDIEHVRLIFQDGGKLIDRVSTVNLVLSKLGMDVTVIDLFESYWNSSYRQNGIYDLKSLFLKNNVKLLNYDLFEFPFEEQFANNSIDCICSFDCFEHLHHSPKIIIDSCNSILKKNGKLIIGTPNPINLYKRIKVLFGRTNMPPFDHFFNNGNPWFGHIREYCYNDYKLLAGYLNYSSFEIKGYNWQLVKDVSFMLDLFLKIIDKTFGMFPSLCTDLYLIAKK